MADRPEAGRAPGTPAVPVHQTTVELAPGMPAEVDVSTGPHDTSMIVWGEPAPAVLDTPFPVRVGVKCSAACDLAGRLVEIRDEAGCKVGEGRLGDASWPGTQALYVAEVGLQAPGTEGVRSWSAAFAAADLDVPHDGTSAAFSFRVARPPEHTVTVRVVEGPARGPLVDGDVHMDIYRASTDEQGIATLEVPKGTYEVSVRKTGYQAPLATLEVLTNVEVEVVAQPVQEKDPDDEMWM